MSDMQEFPENIMDFINAYSFKDRKQIYTNGSSLVPVFRVKQALEHYLKKLAHYEDLEEQGRLIELPCKVGDTVYRIFAYPCDYKNYEIFEKKFEVSDFDKFGKTIFLNKAEAEAKMKEMSSSENPNK